jgi:transcriptional regulator with XRE-family HTH domain
MNREDALKLLGQRVAKVRLGRGLTQEQLAESMGVSRNHIADIELGARNTGVWSILLIARALNVRPGELLDHIR